MDHYLHTWYFGLCCPSFLQSKADAVCCFQDLVSWAEAQTGYQLQSVHSDWGEYINDNLRTFLSSRGIEHQTLVPRTPQQNGQAERFNHTILEKAEAMCQTACLPPSFCRKQLCISIIANLCVVLTGHLLYLNGMARHLVCHTLRFLGVWHMYSYPKRIVKISYQLRPKKQPLLDMRKTPKDTDSGLLSADK